MNRYSQILRDWHCRGIQVGCESISTLQRQMSMFCCLSQTTRLERPCFSRIFFFNLIPQHSRLVCPNIYICTWVLFLRSFCQNCRFLAFETDKSYHGFRRAIIFMAISLFHSRLSVCSKTRGLAIFFVFIQEYMLDWDQTMELVVSPSIVENVIICSRTRRSSSPNIRLDLSLT